MFDAKKVIDEAKKEVAAEQGEKAKEALKAKLRQLDTARAVVKNIEREIDDLQLKFSLA